MSVPNFNVDIAVNGVVTSAFGGILFDFFDHNRGSNCVTTPCRKYYVRYANRLGI